MRRRLVTIAAAASLCAATGASASAPDGKALYARHCASCHGADGKAQTPLGKKIGAADLTQLHDDEGDLVRAIELGRPPRMMPYKGKLAPEEIQAIAGRVKKGFE